MALCVTHNISFDPQWEWCIYCGKPKTAELAVVENTSTNTASTKLPYDIKEKFQRFVDEQVSLPSSFADVVNEHFWDLI